MGVFIFFLQAKQRNLNSRETSWMSDWAHWWGWTRMYNRAKREIHENLGSTPSVVSPGSYALDTENEHGPKNKAPFGSLSERKTLELNAGVLGPSSGYYKVPSQFERISGGNIPFQNGPRLHDPRPVDDNPPPGAFHNAWLVKFN